MALREGCQFRAGRLAVHVVDSASHGSEAACRIHLHSSQGGQAASSCSYRPEPPWSSSHSAQLKHRSSTPRARKPDHGMQMLADGARADDRIQSGQNQRRIIEQEETLLAQAAEGA